MTRFRMAPVRVRDAARMVLPPSREHDDVDQAAADRMFAAAAWSVIPEPGDGIAGVVREAIGAERALSLLIEGADASAWLAAAGERAHELRDDIHAALARWSPRLDGGAVLRALTQGARHGQVLVTPDCDEWPRGLDDLGQHAPAALWVKGDARVLARLGRSVSVVGSRAASSYGEHVAVDAVAGLVERGFVTVSGAAYGIDAVVHRTTLAVGGTTVAVLAGGLDGYYPSGHGDLFARIEATGAIVSEVACGVAPSRWRFLQRNRLIAAMSCATIVIEAGSRSGSINTANHAAHLGRPLGATPGPVTSGASAGCHRLIRDDGAVLVRDAADMAELVDGPVAPDSLGGATGPEELRVLDALSTRQVRGADDVAQRSGMSLDEVHAAIGLLELVGSVSMRGSGWVRQRA